MEEGFGSSLSNVRIHDDATAAGLNQTMSARAFTSGPNIFFGHGQYSPETASGERVLAHEIAHTLQPDQRARRLFADSGKAGCVSTPVRRAVVGGPRYGGKFTNTEDPAFELFDSHDLATQRATAQAEAWRDNVADEPGAIARLTASYQAKPSTYLTPALIAGGTLNAFDRHANEQADWMTGTGAALFSDDQKQAYANLLGLARKDNRRILDACGQFGVAALLALGVGTAAAHNERFKHYAEAVAGVGLTRIESPAANAAEADRWGAALIELATTPRLSAEVATKIIPQRASAPALKRLVDANAVTAFVAYVNAVVDIVLHATDGSEVEAFCQFHAEGGTVAAYAALSPELRHVHRYTVECLDRLLIHRARSAGPAPLTVVMQTALDHNGVSYRNAKITELVKRPARVTVIIESKGTLADFTAAAQTVATRHKTDGKIDEILITGHGESQSMGLAATKTHGRYAPAKQDVGLYPIRTQLIHALDSIDSSRATFRAVLLACPLVTDTSALPPNLDQAMQRLVDASEEDTTVIDKLKAALAGMDEMPAIGLTTPTREFVDRLMEIMRDDAATSRIVLHSCLTASNRVLGDIDGTQPVATQQAAIKAAIAKNPSLVTRIKEQLPNKHGWDIAGLWGKKGVSVLGANASVYGRTTDLHDPGTGRITLTNPGDAHLTAPNKLDYARHGIEPEGALRAAVEAWADNDAATIGELTARVADPASTQWNENVIRALYGRAIANPGDGRLLIALERASGALANLAKPEEASVTSLRATVPAAHANAIFNGLAGAAALASAVYWFTRVVLYQVWIATDAGKRADLLTALDAGAAIGQVTSQSVVRYLDFAGLAPSLGALLPVPVGVGAIRPSATVLALAYVIEEDAAAPAAALAYLRGLLDLRQVDGREFPDEANIDDLLRGASTERILTALGRGVVNAPVDQAARIIRHNVSVARGGSNDITVQSVTLTGLIRGAATPVYDRPDGAVAAQLDDAARVSIHGKIREEWYAIERGGHMEFVRQDRVTLG